MDMETFARRLSRKPDTAAHRAGRQAAERIPGVIASIEREFDNQRQGIKGKKDASRLPSYAREYEQLDPGSGEARPYDDAVWDKHFVATRSSNVQEIFYSSEREVLRAVFLPRKSADGAMVPAAQYLYTGVPAQVYNRLAYVERSGGSVGSEFWNLIRIKPLAHRYNYRKLTGGGLGGKGKRIRRVKGKMARHGMPDLVTGTPDYAPHTRAAMKRAGEYREKRAEARSSRAQAATGGQSARAKRNAGGRR